MLTLRQAILSLATLSTAALHMVGADDSRSHQSDEPVTVEMQLGTEPGFSPLEIQEWYQLLRRLEVAPISIRAANPRDPIEITEQRLGSRRHIVVKGRLDARGQLIVPDRAFSRFNADEISRWLEELRRFGPRGSAEDQPLWGLTEEEFRKLFSALSKPVAQQYDNTPLREVLTGFEDRSGIPIWMHPQLSSRFDASRDPVRVTWNHSGLSLGTSLAYWLYTQGLVFQPELTRDGEVHLVVFPLSATENPWPTGWPPKQSPREVAPQFFEFTPVELVNAELDQVLAGIEQGTGVPLLIDRPALQQEKIDLAQVRVNQPQRRTFWKQVLDETLFSAKLRGQLRIDEAGNPFVWITTVRRSLGKNGL